MNSAIARAADRAVELMKFKPAGLAVHIASRETGITTGQISKELAARRKAKKEAAQRALSGEGKKLYWQEEA